MNNRANLRQEFNDVEMSPQGIFEGDLVGSKIWLIVLIGAVFVFMVGVFLIELLVWIDAGQLLIEELPIWGTPTADSWTNLLTAGLHSLRFLLLPITAFIIVFLVGAHYVQDVYELESYWVAIKYLQVCVFGFFSSLLQIDGGQKVLAAGEVNTLAQIGGPGYVSIRPGNAVLIERLTHPSKVLAAGWHFINRFESIKEICDLNDQHGFVEKKTAMTKDGLLVNIHDMQFRYRVWAGDPKNGSARRSPETPYPYSPEAIFNQAYNRSATKDGLTTWNAAVQTSVDGAVSDYIYGRQMDAITAPPLSSADPRQEIRKKLLAENTRARLREIGAELIWFDIGRFSIEEPVEEQRIQTWGAEWVGDANVIRSYGEAQRRAYEELARSEAQAEIIMSIVGAFRTAKIDPARKSQAVANIFLMKAAQVLETLSKVYGGEGNQPGDGRA